MNITVIRPEQLNGNQVDRWHQLRSCNSALASPFFTSAFILAVNAERGNVFVAVIEDSGTAVGFFPFERTGSRVGRPVGGPVSDYHGLIASPHVKITPTELLSACEISRWPFDHLVDPGGIFAESVEVHACSRYVDLSQGYHAYIQERRQAKSDLISQTLRKEKKFVKDHEQLRFVFHQPDKAVLETLIRWKSEQYHRTNTVDIFSVPWTGSLLRRLLNQPTEDLQAVLSVLYAGDKIAAVHYGLRSQHVLHSWLPAYDIAFSRYSPGALLTLKMLEHCASVGINSFDFGKGTESYKKEFTPLSVPLGEGCVDRCTLRRQMRAAWRRSKDWVKQTPLKGAAKASGQFLYQLQQRSAFRN
jgi:CelD/BcsL family acetyltransferase involved in cellulose biosynthesis